MKSYCNDVDVSISVDLCPFARPHTVYTSSLHIYVQLHPLPMDNHLPRSPLLERLSKHDSPSTNMCDRIIFALARPTNRSFKPTLSIELFPPFSANKTGTNTLLLRPLGSPTNQQPSIAHFLKIRIRSEQIQIPTIRPLAGPVVLDPRIRSLQDIDFGRISSTIRIQQFVDLIHALKEFAREPDGPSLLAL